MHIVRRLIALFALLGATSAFAQSYTYSVYLDTDNNSATGCSVILPGGTVTGAESVITATINAGSPPQVAQVTHASCSGGSFGAPTPTGASDVTVGGGTGGSTAIEISAALASLAAPGANTVRLYVVAQSTDGSDVLLTTTGAPGGAPILLSVSTLPGQGAVPAPMIGIPAVLLLGAALLLIGSRAARRRMIKRLLLGLVLFSGIAGAAALFNWNGFAPLATDLAGDSSSGETAIDLRYFFGAFSNNNVFFRIDVTGDLATPPPKPVAVPDTYNATINTPLSVPAPGVLANDTLNGGTISGHTNPTHGTLVFNADGSFVYTPTTGYTGQDSFNYTLTNAGGSSTALVNIVILNGPAAEPDSYTTVVGTALNVSAPGVLSNDNLGNPNATLQSFGGGSLGGSVTTNAPGASVALGTSGGTLTLNANGSLSLTAPTTAGTYTFLYRIGNVKGTSDATVTIQVNQPPSITSVGPANFSVGTNGTYTITTTGTPTVTSITLTGCALPAGLSFTYTSGATATISGTATAPGTVSCTVTASNGVSPNATQTLVVNATAGPTVTALSPANGPIAGGTVVTITGANFTGATAVKFGATPATTFTVNLPTQITATAPAGSSGTVDVTVTTPSGTSPTGPADKFSYFGPPASIVVASGTPQSTAVGTAFAAPLVVTVLDASSNPVPGATVTFTAPASGASASLSSPAVTNASGQTQVTATANNTSGAYSVSASVSGVVTPATFSLTNTASGATHFVVSAPSTATAGTAFNFTVTALDQFNNTVTGYSGTAHFTSTDGQAVLPADSTLTNGVGTFSATLKTAGNQTLTATDTVTASITGTSGTVAVSTAAATHYAVSAPASAAPGIAFNFTVTAQDPFNNTVTGYSGTAHFTSTDGQAVLPADSTLTNGVGTFSATLKTAGSQTLTATDTVTASITGTSGAIVVSSAAATHYSVSAPASAIAGAAFTFTVTALDQFNNTATGYSGTVHFTSTDAQAVLPADSTLTNGVGTFSATLKTAGSQTLTATDTVTASITGTSGTVTVSAAAATHYTVSAPASAIAGTAFNFTVTALDAFNNTATGYAGTVHFTSTDGQAVLPADSTLTNGTGTFSATLKTAGSQTLTATDTVTASITGTSGTVTVSTAAATHYAVSAPASAIAGTAFTFTVTAQDQFNNTVTGYSGTAHFTSADAQAVLPADSTLTNGTGTFSATLKTAGNQTLTATDTVTAAITGTSNTIAVVATAATHYTVSAPASAIAGTAFNFTVTALDAFNNTATGYAGTVHFTSTDVQAVLPADSTLTNGTGTFSATLKTVGSQTLTATDTVTAAITGTSSTIAVSATAATHYSVSAPASATAGTAFTFTVTALDPFNNTATGYAGTVHFTSTDGQAVLPADSTLTNGTGTFSATLKTVGNQTLTATDTVTASITGTSGSVTVSAAAATHYAVSAPASAIAGTAFTFTVTALDAFNNTATGYAGTVHFTSTDVQAVLPANSTLTNGVGTFSATLKTAGNQTLTATDTVTASITGTSSTVTVSATAATHYAVSAPASATAGTAFNFTVTALDPFNNTATGYAGTAHFTSTDGQAVLPADSTLTNGTGTFSATLKTVGSQTLTATDTVTASIAGTSGTITVSAGAATHYIVSAPASATAGTAFSFTVTAQDQFNNTATGYSGTAHFTSTDAQAVLPADSTLTNGTGTFSATLKTVGSQTLTAMDTVTASITGTSGTVTVSAAAATHYTVSAPATDVSGTAFSFTVTALDQFNNTATAYSGTVHFTSTDAQAVLPADSTLTNGVGTFSATLKTGGNQTITATDTVTASITGTSGPIQVQVPPQITSANSTTFTPGVAGTFTVTTTGFPTGASMLISELGALPAGVNFVNNNNGTATLSGTPGALSQNSSPYALTITANNGIAPNATQGFTLNVVCPTINVSGAIADQTYNTAMSAATFTQSGGHGTITWSASGLAPGEAIGAGSGQVTGTPTNTGTFTASVTATDAFGCSGSGTATYHVNPKASNDSYNALGNVLVTSANGAPAFSVTDNDSFPAGTTISAFDATSAGGGAVTMVTSGANIGQFTYDPPTGASSGTDTLTYTLSSNGRTATGTVTFAITARVWFIDDTAGACSSTCDGRQSHPFTNTSTFQTANTGAAFKPAANDPIFIYTGGSAYSGTITLLNGQHLIGQGALSTLSTLGAVFPQPGQSLPSTGGTPPTLTSAGTTITTGSGNFIHGLNLGNATTALAGTNFGLLTINSNVAINSNGQALNLNNGTLIATIESITSNGGANNIKLISVAGTSTFQHAGIGGALTGATGTAFLMGSAVAGSGGTLTVDYDGAITASAGQSPVILQNRTNGLITLNGAINSTALGVQLLSNTGATTAFTGPLTLATTSNAGFTATGGGTVTATDATSTVTTTTGTAVNIANTTIGAGKVTFKSVSANGAASGIVLNNTGAGSFQVVGNGGTCTSLASTCTGGTIQATTGHAIDLTATTNPSFNFIKVTNIALSGIHGTQVSGFTLANSVIDGVNNSHTSNDSDVAFNVNGGAATENNLSGAVSITNNVINNSYQAGIDILNYNGTISNLTITGNSFTSNTSATLSFGSAISVYANRNNAGAQFASITAGSISNNSIANFPNGAGIQVLAGNNGAGPLGNNIASLASPLLIQDNTISGAAPGAGGLGTNGVQVTVGHLSDGFFTIGASGHPNTITNVKGNGVACSKFGNNSGLGTNASKCIIAFNSINANNTANSPGINTGADQSTANTNTPKLYLDIHNNTVQNTTGNGILSTIRSTDGTGVFNIANNTVSRPTLVSGTVYGIRVDAGNGSESAGATVCLKILGNTTTGSTNGTTTAPGIGLRDQHVAPVATFNIDGLTPNPASDGGPMEGYVNGQNPASASGSFGVGGTASISSGASFHAATCTIP